MTQSQDALDRGKMLFEQMNPKAYAAMSAALSDVSPDLMNFAAAFPFGELYTRPQLPKRERQLVTVAALATRGDAPAQLKVHIEIALNIGISGNELSELFLQLAPYAGFPTAINATMVLREVLAEREQI